MAIYVALFDAINVYGTNANGDIAPIRVITGPNTRLEGAAALAIDNAGYLYVANAATSVVTIYEPNAHGNAVPIRTISGDHTRLAVPMSMAIDSLGNLYVLNTGGARENRTVTVYAPTADGNAAPIAILTSIQGGLVGDLES